MSRKLKAHELLHIQEHLRSEAVTAHNAQSMAEQCHDPELRSFVKEHGRLAQENVQRLMSFLQS